jgi:carboxyl-terminal processing protease
MFAVAVIFSACASSVPDNERLYSGRRIKVDGLDVSAMHAVFIKGFSEIKDRAYQEPDIDNLFLTGLDGLKTFDPDIKVTTRAGHLFLGYGEDKPVDLGAMPRNNIAGWSRATIIAVLAARKASPLVKVADEEHVYKAVFTGALSLLDPFSRYASRQDAARNRLVRDGVIGLGVRVDLVPDGALIQSIVRGGPADIAGLNINDIILTADGAALINQPLIDVRRRLDGTTGSPVQLTVRRPGEDEPLIITAVRDLIVPDTVTTTIADNVAELRIRSFNQRTAHAVERAVAAARKNTNGKLRGIVLDMRGDPGGLLDQAIEIADLFLDHGTIVTLHGRHPGAQQYYAAHRGDIAFGIPMAVIVDGKSASASEIVAAALQDNHRAAVVGTVSWGKGSVQTVLRLPNSGEIALTWARALAPRGVALHGLGLLPDVCLSGEDVAAGDVVGHMFARPFPAADMRRQWRGAPDEPAVHEELRTACPPEAHPDRTVDLDVARRIVSDPALMALAIADSAPQLAVKP